MWYRETVIASWNLSNLAHTYCSLLSGPRVSLLLVSTLAYEYVKILRAECLKAGELLFLPLVLSG